MCYFLLHIRLECDSIPSSWWSSLAIWFLQVGFTIGAQISDTHTRGRDWSRRGVSCCDVIMWFFLFICGGPVCSKCVRPPPKSGGFQVWIQTGSYQLNSKHGCKLLLLSLTTCTTTFTIVQFKINLDTAHRTFLDTPARFLPNLMKQHSGGQ